MTETRARVTNEVFAELGGRRIGRRHTRGRGQGVVKLHLVDDDDNGEGEGEEDVATVEAE